MTCHKRRQSHFCSIYLNLRKRNRHLPENIYPTDFTALSYGLYLRTLLLYIREQAPIGLQQAAPFGLTNRTNNKAREQLTTDFTCYLYRGTNKHLLDNNSYLIYILRLRSILNSENKALQQEHLPLQHKAIHSRTV